MAEAVLRDALKGRKDVVVESAGLGALVGEPASGFSVELMQERGLDISGHRAQQLTAELIARSDLILVMESGHRRAIDANEPTARGKLYRLGEWQDLEIPDPYRQPREAFEETLKLIDKGVADWVERLKA
jgi:protein-tyrosine phosphatase